MLCSSPSLLWTGNWELEQYRKLPSRMRLMSWQTFRDIGVFDHQWSVIVKEGLCDSRTSVSDACACVAGFPDGHEYCTTTGQPFPCCGLCMLVNTGGFAPMNIFTCGAVTFNIHLLVCSA